MRFEELYARQQQRNVTMAEAAEMLGVTERTFRRRNLPWHPLSHPGSGPPPQPAIDRQIHHQH
jgi:hypothetical protein